MLFGNEIFLKVMKFLKASKILPSKFSDIHKYGYVKVLSLMLYLQKSTRHMAEMLIKQEARLSTLLAMRLCAECYILKSMNKTMLS